MMGISRNHALRGYAVWTLCVPADAERPDGIPPERVPIGRGTSIIYQDLFDKTVIGWLTSRQTNQLTNQLPNELPRILSITVSNIAAVLRAGKVNVSETGISLMAGQRERLANARDGQNPPSGVDQPLVNIFGAGMKDRGAAFFGGVDAADFMADFRFFRVAARRHDHRYGGPLGPLGFHLIECAVY